MCAEECGRVQRPLSAPCKHCRLASMHSHTVHNAPLHSVSHKTRPDYSAADIPVGQTSTSPTELQLTCEEQPGDLHCPHQSGTCHSHFSGILGEAVRSRLCAPKPSRREKTFGRHLVLWSLRQAMALRRCQSAALLMPMQRLAAAAAAR